MEAQEYKKLVNALRGKFIAYDVTGNHNSAQLYKDAADAIESLQKELDAANHQLKMYSMCPFDDEEEEA